MIERHVKMIELVAERGEIETGQLARLLNTSEVTVRNDLNTLSKKGNPGPAARLCDPPQPGRHELSYGSAL